MKRNTFPRMKKTSLLTAAAFCLLMCCCESPEKSQRAFDEGITYMLDHAMYTKAEECFTEAIKYNKNNYEAYYCRGCCKFNRNLIDEAIVDLEKALEIKPNYADAEFTLGRIYFVKNDIDMSCYYYKASKEHGRQNVDDLLKGCP